MHHFQQFFIPLHPHLTGGSARTYGSCTANKLHNSKFNKHYVFEFREEDRALHHLWQGCY